MNNLPAIQPQQLRLSAGAAQYLADLDDAEALDGCFFDDMGAISAARAAGFNSPATKPVKPDLYEVYPPNDRLRTGTRFYAIWTGSQWGRMMASKERALACGVPAVNQHKAWREIGAKGIAA